MENNLCIFQMPIWNSLSSGVTKRVFCAARSIRRGWSRTNVGAPKLHGSRARLTAITAWILESLIRMLAHRAHRRLTICSTLKLSQEGEVGAFQKLCNV